MAQYGEIILRYGTARCSLGVVLLAASDAGVCCIEIGDDTQELIAQLQRYFPRAQFAPVDSQVEQWLREIVQFIEYPHGAPQLPLDIQGTVFQRQVWQALRDIPLGATASYAEISTRIGKPRAVRAVASACANNKLAPVIPCHRVIRSDGGLGGYRWGIARKQQLLQREAAQAKRAQSQK